MQLPEEYCFLWITHWSTCMTKAEWSGWVQAVGAIVALAVAIGLAAFQLWHSERMQRAQQSESERRQAAHVHHIVVGVVHGAVRYAQSHLQAALRPGDKFTMRVERLEEALRVLNQAILMPLPPDVSRVLFNVNSILSNLLHVAEDAAGGSIAGNEGARAALETANAMWGRVIDDLAAMKSNYELTTFDAAPANRGAA